MFILSADRHGSNLSVFLSCPEKIFRCFIIILLEKVSCMACFVGSQCWGVELVVNDRYLSKMLGSWTGISFTASVWVDFPLACLKSHHYCILLSYRHDTQLFVLAKFGPEEVEIWKRLIWSKVGYAQSCQRIWGSPIESRLHESTSVWRVGSHQTEISQSPQMWLSNIFSGLSRITAFATYSAHFRRIWHRVLQHIQQLIP